MEKYTYLLINFFTIIICLIYSFDRRIKFNQYFKTFLISSTIVAIPFIIWDIYFTKIGVWWFNETYLIGLRISNLPIEEILFFYCIPFSCVFTYFCLTKFFTLTWGEKIQTYLVPISICISLSITIIHYDKIYTWITFFSCAVSLVILQYILLQKWIGKACIIYSILMLGFIPVNGILTGTGLENPIVNYNPNDFMNIRFLTIPIEDAVYGFVLIIWNIYFFEKLKNNWFNELN